jgi:hypothetical protein
MRGVCFKTMKAEDRKGVRDFFRDAENLAPEDIDKFLGNLERYAGKMGGMVNVEKSSSNDALGMELWLEHLDRISEMRRIFAIRRLAIVIELKGRRRHSAAGPYYMSRGVTPLIQPYAILVTPAVMDTRPENLIEILKNIRIIRNSKEREKVREAKYDLRAACTGTKIGFVDLFSGERMEILGH